MTPGGPTVVLFDIDGTLLSCGGAGRAAMQRATEELLGRRDVLSFGFGGMTDYGIARTAFEGAGCEATAADLDRFIERYLAYLELELELAGSFSVMPGVTSLLDQLSRTPSVVVGLGTGNVERGAMAKLRRGGLEARFEFGGFGSDHEDRSQLLAVGAERGARRSGSPLAECDVVVIGDTPRDVAAARAVGARCLAVATGGHDEAELQAAGATATLKSLADSSAVMSFLNRPSSA